MATARDGNNGERPPRRRQARVDIDHTFLEDSAEDTGKTLHTKDGQVWKLSQCVMYNIDWVFF